MKITWFGHSAFRVELGSSVILIDPFFTGNPSFEGGVAEAAAGATHILITHGHGDHVGDTVEIAKSTGAKVVTNYDLAMWLCSQGVDKFDPMNTGGTTDQGDFTVTLVRADHSASLTGVQVPLGNANGVIVQAPDEPVLWHMGDTDIFSDMGLLAEIHDVKVCICPIGDRFTMSPHTAAIAMKKFVTPKVAIPCHYGTFPIIEQTPERFCHEMMGSGIEVIVPQKGEAFTL
ncbi:MAG: metal-dependent hydrolase [Blastochloris sp.]|nr:metal-dependent hydrolase [Blastochloris sp.]